MPTYILAADQGTTSSRALLFDLDQNVVAMSQREIMQTYPRDGWVEEDPMEIYSSQLGVINEVVAKSGVNATDIAALGITNQRETVIVWDRETGRPIHDAIVWQCRRTASICEELKKQGLTEYVRETTGLVIDAYFSGTKIKWILDHVPEARERARRGELLCGTVDSWLIYKLTDGRVHATDYTNASRTMLYDIRNLCWDRRLCDELDIPLVMLPEVRPSNGHYGSFNLGGVEIPIHGVAGDQQAALFGQTCFEKGEVKNTYGTGCFLLANTGDAPCYSRHGLITTLAASSGRRVQYALEGSVFVAGAAIQWLRDELGLIRDASDTEYFAAKVPDTAGVFLVPAFTGLGAPYWDMYARGTIVGLTRGAGRNHIIRAALESIAFQSNAVLRAMEGDMGCRLRELRVDGGASSNNFLMQFQSDISDLSILRPRVRETTALGAAYLAGLGAGVWTSLDDIRRGNGIEAVFSPIMLETERAALCRGYERAVERAQGWAE